jgi:hypothetical protein
MVRRKRKNSGLFLMMTFMWLALAMMLAIMVSAQGMWAVAPGQQTGLLGDWNRGASIQAYGPGWGYRATGVRGVAPVPYYDPWCDYPIYDYGQLRRHPSRNVWFWDW